MITWAPALKKNIRELLIVFFIFASLVLISFLLTSGILSRRLTGSANELLRTAEANIRMSLEEPKATLVSSGFNIRDMIVDKDHSQEDIFNYLVNITDYLMEKEDRLAGFHGMYGFIRGDYLDGLKWEPPADYAPQNRPWHQEAKSANGEIAITDPYVDAQTSLVVVSFAQEIF